MPERTRAPLCAARRTDSLATAGAPAPAAATPAHSRTPVAPASPPQIFLGTGESRRSSSTRAVGLGIPFAVLLGGEHEDGTVVEMLRALVHDAVDAALETAQSLSSPSSVSYRQAERELRDAVFVIGRALLVLFLGLRQVHVMAAHRAAHGTRYQGMFRTLRQAPPIARNSTRS